MRDFYKRKSSKPGEDRAFDLTGNLQCNIQPSQIIVIDRNTKATAITRNLHCALQSLEIKKNGLTTQEKLLGRKMMTVMNISLRYILQK